MRTNGHAGNGIRTTFFLEGGGGFTVRAITSMKMANKYAKTPYAAMFACGLVGITQLLGSGRTLSLSFVEGFIAIGMLVMFIFFVMSLVDAYFAWKEVIVFFLGAALLYGGLQRVSESHYHDPNRWWYVGLLIILILGHTYDFYRQRIWEGEISSLLFLGLVTGVAMNWMTHTVAGTLFLVAAFVNWILAGSIYGDYELWSKGRDSLID